MSAGGIWPYHLALHLENLSAFRVRPPHELLLDRNESLAASDLNLDWAHMHLVSTNKRRGSIGNTIPMNSQQDSGSEGMSIPVAQLEIPHS